MRSSLFRIYFFATLAGTLALLLAAMGVSALVLRDERGRLSDSILHLLATALEEKAPPGNDDSSSTRPDFWLVDENGQVLRSSTRAPLPHPWGDTPRPVNPLEPINYPPRLIVFPDLAITRLPGESRYLVFRVGPLFSGFRLKTLMLITFLVGISLSALSFSLLIAVSYMRRRAREADEVLSRLKSGDLRARFKIGRIDELGRAMLSFNQMADEVAGLVERLRHAETSRTQLIRELGHDVRTPLTSLHNFIETLLEHGNRLSAEERDETLKIALLELDYLKKLLEDLLFLAQLSDPSYRAKTNVLDLADLLRSELEQLRPHCEAFGKKLGWEIRPLRDARVRGNPLLVERLVRNAVDNARKFAKSEIQVHLNEGASGGLEILVQDDGTGLSLRQLQGFGEKSQVRSLEQSHGSPSLGLGSVIMKAIVAMHGGSLTISNRMGNSGEILGAALKISIPKGG